jgi:hypothetical protein
MNMKLMARAGHTPRLVKKDSEQIESLVLYFSHAIVTGISTKPTTSGKMV